MSRSSDASKATPPLEILKIMSWNVASLRAAWRHGLQSYILQTQPDIFCIQETKMSPSAKPPIEDMQLTGYHGYFNHAKKKGYSGTAIFTKIKPLSIRKSAGISDENGRCITAEFSHFYLVNVYVVNAGASLENLITKTHQFLPELLAHVESLRSVKPVIWTGDFNVAHQDIDLWSTEGFDTVAGFTPEERSWFADVIRRGYVDVFRNLYPQRQQFTYFDFMGHDRAKNRGWRIDYFVVSPELLRDNNQWVYDCAIDSGPTFSDHCPIVLLLDRAKSLGPSDQAVQATAVEVLQ
jgi:exodeoxyribonuclease-3